MWYEELGYDDNPLEANPFRVNFPLVNRSREAADILYAIDAGNMLVIEGKDGIGKTMLLRHAITKHRGKGKVIYIDGNTVSKRLNIESLLVKRSGLFRGRLLKHKPRGMILLFDNVQQLTKKNCEHIKYFYDQDYLKSVIFTLQEYKAAPFTDSLRDRIGERVIRLRPLDDQEAAQVIMQRLPKSWLAPDLIAGILEESEKSLALALQHTSYLMDYAAANKKEKLTKTEIKKLLRERTREMPAAQGDLCPDCSSPLEHIGEYWRCSHCDTYCKNCGAAVDKDDADCPECGIRFTTVARGEEDDE
ncbi:AAA family ATPase [Candidatus Woesearchaeota archaeon]|nr:AAA family ATPase [Candidatus Woesearchaeota archaeon]